MRVCVCVVCVLFGGVSCETYGGCVCWACGVSRETLWLIVGIIKRPGVWPGRVWCGVVWCGVIV